MTRTAALLVVASLLPVAVAQYGINYQILYQPRYCYLGDPVRGCASNTDCTTNYDCTTGPDGQKFCCPNEFYVCRLRRDVGSRCTNETGALTRWYFDRDTLRCASFQYNGCGGNENRFETENQCANYCVFRVCQYGAPVRESTTVKRCSHNSDCPDTHDCQTPRYGPASANVCCSTARSACTSSAGVGYNCFVQFTSITTERYFHNSVTKTCLKIDFNGCGWEANHFRTEYECNTKCQYATCPIGSPLMQGGTAQSCDRTCPPGYDCYQGICCPRYNLSRRSIAARTQFIASACNLGVDQGYSCGSNTNNEVGRWFYNSQLNECQRFVYQGCGGNSNRFNDPGACIDGCVTKAALNGICPGGLFVDVFAGTNNPRTCNLNVVNDCGLGSTCLKSISLSRFVCCQGLPQCANDLRTATIGNSIQPRICTSDIACPQGATCTPSANVAGVNICCLGRYDVYCPAGLETNFATCQVGSTSCGEGYICIRPYEATTSTARRGYCCRASPRCVNAPALTRLKACSQFYQLGNECELGWHCQTSSIPSISVCCPSNERSFCPNGGQPMVNPSTQLTQFCQPFLQDTQCTLQGFRCVQAVTNPGQYICCPSLVSPVINNLCPGSLSTNGLQCRINPFNNEDRCLPSYTCLPNPSDLAPIGRCCQVARLQCPVGQQPQLTAAGTEHVCGDRLTSCDRGFTCQPSTNVLTVLICCRPGEPSNPVGVSTSTGTGSSQQEPMRCANAYAPLRAAATGQLIDCLPGMQPDPCTYHGAYACQSVARTVTKFGCCPTTAVDPNPTPPATPPATPQPPPPTAPAAAQGSNNNRVPVCQSGAASLQQAALPIQCPPGSDRCPAGYACQPSSWSDTHLCCAVA